MNLFILLLFAIFTQISSKELPEFLNVCKRNDPNLQSCIKDTVLYLKPYLAKGIPELKIPPIEPLKMKETLTVNPTRGVSVGLKMSVKNLKIYGCSDYDILDLHYDVDNIRVNFTIKLNHLFIKGEFETDGRILFIPITGNGKFLMNSTDSVSHCKVNGELIQRNGEKYVKMNELILKIGIGKGIIEMKGLFGRGSTLGDIISTVINENFHALAPDFIPALERELSSYFLDVTNKIYSTYTFEQLFPM